MDDIDAWLDASLLLAFPESRGAYEAASRAGVLSAWRAGCHFRLSEREHDRREGVWARERRDLREHPLRLRQTLGAWLEVAAWLIGRGKFPA